MTRALALASILALAACTTSAHVVSDYDHSTRFSSFHTFVLVMRPHPGSPSALAVQQTYDALRETLAAKGFTCTTDPGEADFAVDFTVGARDRLDVSSYRPAGWYGGWWGDRVDVRQYQEGTLSIDVFDLHSQKPVWHGSAKKEISQGDVDHSQATIRQAVTDVLAGFPPGGA